MNEKIQFILGIKDKYSKGFKKFTKSSVRAFKVAGAAVAAYGVALAAMTKTYANAGDAALDFSQRIGADVEGLTELHHAAEMSGIGVSTLNMALQRSTRRVAEAAQGYGEARTAIKELGLDAERLSALSPDEQFMRISAALKDVTTHADKVRLAFKLFDSEGVSALQMIDGVVELREEAHLLGITFTQLEAQQASDFNDSLERMGKAALGVRNTFAKEFVPGLTVGFDAITDAIIDLRKDGDLQEWAQDMAEGTMDALGRIMSVMRFFHNGWYGIKLAGNAAFIALAEGLNATFEGLRILLKPLDLIFKGLQMLDKTVVNPFDVLDAGIENFRMSTRDVMAETLQDIVDTNAGYDATQAKLKELIETMKAAKDSGALSLGAGTDDGGGDGFEEKNAILQAQLDTEFSMWEFFYARRVALDEHVTLALLQNAELHAMAERARGNIVSTAYRGMDDAMLQFLNTGKLSLSSMGKVVANQVKIELTGIAVRSGVQALYQTALGLGNLPLFPSVAALHFASAKQFVATAALAGVGAAATQGMFGGATTRPAPGAIGGDPIRTTSVGSDFPTRSLEQPQEAPQKIDINIYNPLDGDIADSTAEAIVKAVNRAGDRDVTINLTAIEDGGYET